MPTVQKTPLGGRQELDAIVAQVNALIADLAALRVSMGVGDNLVLGRDDLTATIADLTAIRNEVIDLVTDVGALRTTLAAVQADTAEIRDKLNTLVTEYNLTLAKLDLDATVTDTDYAATNPGVAPAALTSSAPAVIVAINPAALTTSTTLGIGNGTTAGRLRTNADIEYAIGGTIYRKAATDNLWNLSAETDTTGAQYRAYRLYLDSAGGATAAPSANAASAAAALAALPANVATKVTVGIFVAGPSTDFDNAGGLAAQGTIYEGQTSTVTDLAAATAEAITLAGP